MIKSNPPTAKMILVSAGTDPSAPVPLLAAEDDYDDDDYDDDDYDDDDYDDDDDDDDDDDSGDNLIIMIMRNMKAPCADDQIM